MTGSLRNRNGFTLIELSIVLIIIGLIAASILVGRDLINAAKVRAQVTQIENIKSAVRAFRLKYNAIPGDIPAADARSLGMKDRSGAPGHGDGDGMISGCSSDTIFHIYGCETALFWSDLKFAELIAGDFSEVSDNPILVTEAEKDKYFLPAKIGTDNHIVAFYNNESDAGTAGTKNGQYFSLRRFHGTQANGQYLADDTGISPLEAYWLDTKIDDGLPYKGRLVAGNNKTISSPDTFRLYVIPYISSSSHICVDFDTDIPANMDAHKTVYLIKPKDGKEHSCAINFGL